MTSGRFGASRGDVLRLFEGESVAGLGDGDLLGRFADRRDEAAFEGLVARLGPMVLGVCRRMLADPHDVEDAFQATFLVLVRRAGSIRDRDLVAPWLHGVATRVARRARAESSRRMARERLAVVPEAREEDVGLESGWPELRALIDEEIGRLPEHHRRAVVLCDVEGLSREEAARRLGWSLNMVRGRLERARGRLRGRLARRGLAPSGGWAALLVAPPMPPTALLASTTRAALASSAGRMGTGLATASAVALAQGVSRMMMLSKLKVGLAVLLSTGFVAAGSGMLAAQGPGDGPASKAGDAPSPPRSKTSVAAGHLAALGKSRIEMARKRYETQLKVYGEGRITVDRLLNASQTLMDAEFDAADAPEARLAAIRADLDRIKDIEKRELAELAVGRATEADVEEVQTHRLDVEFRLAREQETAGRQGLRTTPPADPRPADPTARSRLAQDLKARAEIARRLFEQARRLFPGEVAIGEVLDASKTLMEAERDAAGSKAGRSAAVKAHIDRIQGLMVVTEQPVKKGERKPSDLDLARLRILEAEYLMANETGPADGVAPHGDGPRPSEAPKVEETPGKGRVEMAREAYEAAFQETLEKLVGPPRPDVENLIRNVLNGSRAELLYLWSRRWMEARRDLGGGDKANEIAALEAHLGRMKALEQGAIIKAWMKKVGSAPITDEAFEAEALKEFPDFQKSAKFYRVEAESWLSRAKAGRKGGEIAPTPTPF